VATSGSLFQASGGQQINAGDNIMSFDCRHFATGIHFVEIKAGGRWQSFLKSF
jgi:hypothetical protein